jgi:hypothetical protein
LRRSIRNLHFFNLKNSRTITDDVTGESFTLTDREMEIIRRIKNSQYADPDFDQVRKNGFPKLYFETQSMNYPSHHRRISIHRVWQALIYF